MGEKGEGKEGRRRLGEASGQCPQLPSPEVGPSLQVGPIADIPWGTQSLLLGPSDLFVGL